MRSEAGGWAFAAPSVRPVEVVADGLAFANDVALTHDGDAVWVAETGVYRISRVWLGGQRRGQREVIVDDLPAFPDNL